MSVVGRSSEDKERSLICWVFYREACSFLAGHLQACIIQLRLRFQRKYLIEGHFFLLHFLQQGQHSKYR